MLVILEIWGAQLTYLANESWYSFSALANCSLKRSVSGFSGRFFSAVTGAAAGAAATSAMLPIVNVGIWEVYIDVL